MVLDNDLSIHLDTKAENPDKSKIVFGQTGGHQPHPAFNFKDSVRPFAWNKSPSASWRNSLLSYFKRMTASKSHSSGYYISIIWG